jgi:hypothetical protein
VPAGAVVEQALESGADGDFVGDAEVVELAQGGVVILDPLVRWLQFQPLHGRVLHRGGMDGNVGLDLGVIEMNGSAPLAQVFNWPHAAPDGAWLRLPGAAIDMALLTELSGPPSMRHQSHGLGKQKVESRKQKSGPQATQSHINATSMRVDSQGIGTPMRP